MSYWKWFLFSFRGRISRRMMWLFLLLYIVTPIALYYVEDIFFGTEAGDTGPLLGLFALISIWPYFAVLAKRCHDRNISGWWTLLVFVPFVNMVFLFIYLGMLRGTKGSNRFGADPLALPK